MFKKYRTWWLVGLAPVVYVASYFAYRQTHLYEDSCWENNLFSPRWVLHFGSSLPEMALSLVFGPPAFIDMMVNDLAISRMDGGDLERVGLSLRSKYRRPTSDPKFRAVVAQLIKDQGDVVAVIGLPDRVGPSYEIFRSQAAFDKRLSELPATAHIVVHGDRWLPVRGIVDDTFVEHALAEINDGSEWVLICERKSGAVQFHGETHTVLRAKLEECRGHTVAAGYQPHWHSFEGQGDTEGIVPNPDGTVTCGNLQYHEKEVYPGLDPEGQP